MAEKYFVHKSSFVDDNARIGKGTHIWHFCHISTGARIGENCNIGQNVFVDKDVIIGNGVKIQNNVSVYRGVIFKNNVFCGPSCVFTNVINPRSGHHREPGEYKETIVEKGASIGANSTIICGNNIGKHAFIGAGAVVTKDVPDYALVYGNPARMKGWMCECGEKLTVKNKGLFACKKCKQKYIKSNNNVSSLHKGPRNQ